MSRWLKSVNTLLETLDGQAENVAETVAEVGNSGLDDQLGQLLENGRQAVAAGLTNRGSSDDDYYEDEEEYDEDNSDLEEESDYDDEYEEEIIMEAQENTDEEVIDEEEEEDAADLDSDEPENNLEEALAASSDNEEVISLNVDRSRNESDGYVAADAVSDISFSEYTEEELEDCPKTPSERELRSDVASAPRSTDTTDAPPKTPSRYLSRPDAVEELAQQAASQHTSLAGEGAKGDALSSDTQEEKTSISPRPAMKETTVPNSSIVHSSHHSKSVSPKVDSSPRFPRRSIDGTNIPKAGVELLESLQSSDEDEGPGTGGTTDSSSKPQSESAPPRYPPRRTSSNDQKPKPPVSGASSAITPELEKGDPQPVPPRQNKQNQKLKDKVQQLQSQLNQTTKELKTSQGKVQALQKQVQTFNSKLETANSEIHAQSEELRRAGQRMEKDRLRAQEEREELCDEQDEEVEQLRKTHESELDGLRNQYEQQIASLTERLHNEEARRQQEGGDYTQDLQDAVQRERDALKQLNDTTEEKTEVDTLVVKLQTQQDSLQAQLESALSSVKAGSERERQAEDKLDAAMSLHTKQMSQRQEREAQLEKTIAELGAALTVARQRQQQTTSLPTPASGTTEPSDIPEDSYKDKFAYVSEELDTLRVQFNMETQRREALQQELSDIAKERAEEASGAQERQRLTDRKVSDLESTISRLKASLRGHATGIPAPSDDPTNDLNGGSDGNQQLVAQQLKQELQSSKREVENLSTQLLRHQGMAESTKSEILALKGRLQAATGRAEQAEKSLIAAQSAPSSGDGLSPTGRLYNMEAGGNIPTGIRRRVKGGNTRRSRTIRAALQMGPGRTNSPFMEQVATTLDALDSWMVETGSFLRHEPLARLGFMMYLMVLHIWSFALVVFHTTEQPHGDFGSMDSNPRHWRAGAVEQPP